MPVQESVLINIAQSVTAQDRRETILPAARGLGISHAKGGARGWLRKAIWIWPLMAALCLCGLASWLGALIESQITHEVKARTQSILDSEVAAVNYWLNGQRTAVSTTAANRQLVRAAKALFSGLTTDSSERADPNSDSPAAIEIRQLLEPILTEHEYPGWILVGTDQSTLACVDGKFLTGIEMPVAVREDIVSVLNGRRMVSPPQRLPIPMLDRRTGQMVTGNPFLVAWAPITDRDGTTIAALGLQISPDREFTSVLRFARIGLTGEAYAISRDGTMLSESRFEDDLRAVGLLADNQSSILNVAVRDPGVDLIAGHETPIPLKKRRLTWAAKTLLTKGRGINVQGFADYRGATVIGAVKWLSDHGLGVIVEQDYAEAFQTLTLLKRAFWLLMFLLTLSSAIIFLGMLRLARAEQEARQLAVRARQLGQYSLSKKLGQGGMGVVYEAHHNMLRRPTAVKFLDAENTNPESIARFEREVQITAQLGHPNTITIYDYGRTEEGVFYYAMELLRGMDLEYLVQRYGMVPQARAVHILRQVCGSLEEAHGVQLIHRDVKPANIMLTKRGGSSDFVKLLDFGLVKPVKADNKFVSDASLAGTPLYMAPEAISSPDSADMRADIYSLGAVAYFLLTGKTLFEGRSFIEIIRQQVSTKPIPPSSRTDVSVDAQLEQLVMQCVEKQPIDRPQSIRQLDLALAEIQRRWPWTEVEAKTWWEEIRPKKAAKGSVDPVSLAVAPGAISELAMTVIAG